MTRAALAALALLARTAAAERGSVALELTGDAHMRMAKAHRAHEIAAVNGQIRELQRVDSLEAAQGTPGDMPVAGHACPGHPPVKSEEEFFEVKSKTNPKGAVLTPGARVEVVREFKSDTKGPPSGPVILTVGQRGTVNFIESRGETKIAFDDPLQLFDEESNTTLSNASASQWQWVLPANLGHLRGVLRNAARTGLEYKGTVQVVETFESNSREGKVNLTEGQQGYVLKFDNKKNAFIDFICLNTQQWVLTENFYKLKVVVKPKDQPVFVMDNSTVHSSPGVSYRRSKNMSDKEGNMFAKWGSMVQGVETPDGWLRTGKFLLPLKVDGVAIMVPYQGAGAPSEIEAGDTVEVLDDFWTYRRGFFAEKGAQGYVVAVQDGNAKIQFDGDEPHSAKWVYASDDFFRLRVAIKEKDQPKFRVDNSKLNESSQGLEYFKGSWGYCGREYGVLGQCYSLSRHGVSEYAPWGSTVRGLDTGDGWLRVRELYLPLEMPDVHDLYLRAAREVYKPSDPPPRGVAVIVPDQVGYVWKTTTTRTTTTTTTTTTTRTTRKGVLGLRFFS